MGSNIWKSLSVLSLGLAALVGCNTPEKTKTASTYQNPGPMKSVAGGQPSSSQFPTGQGQALQQQPFPQQGTFQPNGQGSYVTTGGTRTGAPLPPTGANPAYNPPNPYQPQSVAPPPGPAFPGGPPLSSTTNPYGSPAAPFPPPAPR